MSGLVRRAGRRARAIIGIGAARVGWHADGMPDGCGGPLACPSLGIRGLLGRVRHGRADHAQPSRLVEDDELRSGTDCKGRAYSLAAPVVGAIPLPARRSGLRDGRPPGSPSPPCYSNRLRPRAAHARRLDWPPQDQYAAAQRVCGRRCSWMWEGGQAVDLSLGLASGRRLGQRAFGHVGQSWSRAAAGLRVNL